MFHDSQADKLRIPPPSEMDIYGLCVCGGVNTVTLLCTWPWEAAIRQNSAIPAKTGSPGQLDAIHHGSLS